MRKAHQHTTNRLSDEDQLYVWCLLVQQKLVGDIGSEYALLVPDDQAVAEVNGVSDTPITVKHLPSILSRFSHLAPPYAAIPSNRRRAYKRDWMQRKRCGQKWEARTAGIDPPKSVHSAL